MLSERSKYTPYLLQASVFNKSETDSLGAEYSYPEFQLESSMLITPVRLPSYNNKLIVFAFALAISRSPINYRTKIILNDRNIVIQDRARE